MSNLSPFNTRSHRPTPKMPWLINSIKFLVFLPALIYFYSIYAYTTNIPFSDDYNRLNRIIPIIQSDTLQEKLKILFSYSLEQLLLVNKVVILLIYSVWGEIDLKIARFVGNCPLLVLLFFAYKTLPENREKIFLVFPSALILFQLKPNWFSIACGNGNIYALCFSGLVFYFLGKNSIRYFFGASFFAICSTISIGSGLATLAAGWLTLIIQGRFKLAWIWLVGTLIFVGSFSLGTNNLASPLTSSFLTIPSWDDLVRMGIFLISFLGTIFSFESQTTILTFGALIICYFIYLLYRKYYAINLAVFSFMVCLILVAAIAAWFRSGLGENAVLADRYKVYSLIMILLIYISVVDLFYSRINQKLVFIVGMIMITGSIYLVSYSEGKQKLAFSKNLLIWRTNQWLDQNYNLMAHPFQKQANSIMTMALTSGYYKLPYQHINIPDERYSKSVNSVDLCMRESETPFKSDFNVITVGPELSPFLVRIEGMIYDQKLPPPEKVEPVHVILTSSKGRYIFTAHSQEHVKKSIHYRQGTTNKGLLALIPFNKLKDNIYRLGLCYSEEVVFSNHLIIKQNHQFKHVVK